MAATTLGDLFAPNPYAAYSVVQSYMDTDPVSRTPLVESGLLTADPIVAELAGSPSNIVTLPYWKDIDASIEPNYSNDVYEDVAVPRSINAGEMVARNVHVNEGFSAMRLVREIRGLDPLQRVAQRLDLYWQEEAEYRVSATLSGIFADNATAADMTYDAVSSPTGDALIDAQMTMGDAFGGIAGYMMHSKVFTPLLKTKLASQSGNGIDTRITREYHGLPVIVNDRASVVNVGGVNKYLTTLMGPGAFAYGVAEPAQALEYDSEPARGNGGGAQTLWTRKNMIVHPLGYTFNSTSITGNGTETVARGAGWTDVSNPANWDRVADRKQIPIAFMLSNVA